MNLRRSETTPDKHMLNESVQGSHIEYVEYQEVDGESSFYGGKPSILLALAMTELIWVAQCKSLETRIPRSREAPTFLSCTSSKCRIYRYYCACERYEDSQTSQVGRKTHYAKPSWKCFVDRVANESTDAVFLAWSGLAIRSPCFAVSCSAILHVKLASIRSWIALNMSVKRLMPYGLTFL